MRADNACSPQFVDSCDAVGFMHTVASPQATGERAVVEMRRGDDPGQTSLAEATAAIISAHWNGASRLSWPRRQRPPAPPLPAEPTGNGNSFLAEVAGQVANALAERAQNGNGAGREHDGFRPPTGYEPPAPSPGFEPPAGFEPVGPPPGFESVVPPAGFEPPAPPSGLDSPVRTGFEPPLASTGFEPPGPAVSSPYVPPPLLPPPGSPYEAVRAAPVVPVPYPPPYAVPSLPEPASPNPLPGGRGPLASGPPPLSPAPEDAATANLTRIDVDAPPPPVIPAQRRSAPPPEPESADFGFADSIMSDVAFPEPLLPEALLADPFPPAPPATPVGAERSGGRDRLEVDTEAMLPQRVPGVPDVPEVPLSPNDPLRDPETAPVADGVELSRIATYLRDDRTDDIDRRPDGFDLASVLEAVRSVPAVRDAQLRWNSGYGHTLRIEFTDDADEGQVTREVARLLREKMGLAAEPSPAWLSPEESTLDRPGTSRQQRHGLAGPAGFAPAGFAPSGPAPAGFAPAGFAPSGPAPAGFAPSAPPPVRPRTDASPVGDVRPELAPRGARPLPPPGAGGPRVVLDNVQVTTLGVDATVLVRLDLSTGGSAVGKDHGPAVDTYLLRLAASAAADAIDQLLVDSASGMSRGRCFVEHVGVVPFAGCEVAVVVLLLVCGTFAEQLSGSALVAGDPRQAVVRATLSAVNRRLESLLA
jgi:hypothetical protein